MARKLIASQDTRKRRGCERGNETPTKIKPDSGLNGYHQVFSFLFITGESLSKETVSERLMDYVLEKPPHHWTNIVFALDKYLATFCCDAGICPNPMDARGIAVQPATDQDEILMQFYLLLGGAIEGTRVSGLPYWEYLHSVRTWSADVFYSATDDPPPYLSAIPH